jgi:hypothetical protein
MMGAGRRVGQIGLDVNALHEPDPMQARLRQHKLAHEADQGPHSHVPFD